MSLSLESFEVVAAPRGACLARVAGRWEGRAPAVGALVVDTGRAVVRATALPAPPGENGLWRAAFALAEAPVGRAVFALELADGTLIDLPRPRVRELAAARAPR